MKDIFPGQYKKKELALLYEIIHKVTVINKELENEFH